MFNISYDRKAHALYIKLNNRKVYKCVPILNVQSAQINADMTRADVLIGVEIVMDFKEIK